MGGELVLGSRIGLGLAYIRAQTLTGACSGLMGLGRTMSAGNGQTGGRESSWGQIVMELIPTFVIDGATPSFHMS